MGLDPPAFPRQAPRPRPGLPDQHWHHDILLQVYRVSRSSNLVSALPLWNVEFYSHPFVDRHYTCTYLLTPCLLPLTSQAWTFTHLYYPEIKRGIRDVRDVERDVGNIEHWIVQKLSLPSNLGSPRKQFAFHMFYSTTTVFAFMNLVTWIITRQHNPHATSAEGPCTFFRALICLSNMLQSRICSESAGSRVLLYSISTSRPPLS